MRLPSILTAVSLATAVALPVAPSQKHVASSTIYDLVLRAAGVNPASIHLLPYHRRQDDSDDGPDDESDDGSDGAVGGAEDPGDATDGTTATPTDDAGDEPGNQAGSSSGATASSAPSSAPSSKPSGGSCNVVGCAAALGPAAVSCGGSILEEGANVIADAGCIASVVNDVANPPASCSGCA